MRVEKIIRILLCLSIIPFYNSTSIAAEESESTAEDEPAWEFTLGAKGVYSSGISDANTYYKPFAGAAYNLEYLTPSVEAGRYFEYQITDGAGLYEYIAFNELSLSLDLFPFDWLSVDLEGRYSRGDSEYTGKGFTGGVFFDFDPVTVYVDAGGSVAGYEIDSAEFELVYTDCSGEIDYSFTDSFSIDAGIIYNKLNFNDEYDYSKTLYRLGMFSGIFGDTFLMAGASLGEDSDDYTIMGADAALSMFFGNYIRVIAMYQYQYYSAPDVTVDSDEVGTGSGAGGGPHSAIVSRSGGGYNPYLSSSNIDESYSSSILSLSVSCVF